MRDPNRIKIILDKIEILRKEHPDLRLGQFILNSIKYENKDAQKIIRNLFYMEDEKLIELLEKFYKK